MQLALGIFKDQIVREPVVLMRDNFTVVACIKKWGHTVSSNVRSRTGGFHLGKTVCSLFSIMLHSGEEVHSRQSAQPSRPGASHKMVSSSPCV